METDFIPIYAFVVYGGEIMTIVWLKDLNLKIEELNQAKESEDGVEERIHKMKEVLEGQVDFEIERLPEEVIDAFVEKIIVFEDYMEWH